jgi:PilZ domain-containing protein
LNRKKIETERRKWDRLPLAIPVFVSSTGENGQELLEFSSAVNISAGGALVAMHRCVPLSARVLLQIPNAPVASVAASGAKTRAIRAETVRVAHGEGYHLVGLRFSVPIGKNGTSRGATIRKSASSL